MKRRVLGGFVLPLLLALFTSLVVFQTVRSHTRDLGHVTRAGRAESDLGALIKAVVDAQDAGALPAGADPRAASRTIWATLHGLAVLEARAGLAKLGLSDTRERLVADAFALLLR